MHTIGYIDSKIYSCITEDICTCEVIITDRQIAHIKERHPGDYEKFFKYLSEIIADPDYILEANKPDTALVLKQVELATERFQLVLRIKTSKDPADYKNSIITFFKIEQKKWDKYLRNKKILYSRN